ncbi:unnamed protein product, partial [Onchocerca ochengi]|uniref:Uncharacterized protein n=1 Tax=Onchocerca ochengi TaxID=42157 RepID=A0A182F046_ONCOC
MARLRAERRAARSQDARLQARLELPETFAFPQQPQQQQWQQPQVGTSVTGQQNDNGNNVPQMPFPPACFSMPQFPVEPSRFPFM